MGAGGGRSVHCLMQLVRFVLHISTVNQEGGLAGNHAQLSGNHLTHNVRYLQHLGLSPFLNSGKHAGRHPKRDNFAELLAGLISVHVHIVPYSTWLVKP